MKFFVLVTNCSPLTIHVHKEGIVRFSPSKYDITDINNKKSHFTNGREETYQTLEWQSAESALSIENMKLKRSLDFIW